MTKGSGKVEAFNNKSNTGRKKTALDRDASNPANTHGKGKAHGEGKRRKDPEGRDGVECHGVGFCLCYRANLEKSRVQYRQMSSWLLEIEFIAAGSPLCICSSYAPQIG